MFVFPDKNVAQPKLHVLGHFNVECRKFKLDDTGKRIGVGMEIKFKMENEKLEQIKVDAAVETWSSDEINRWL